MNVTIEKLDHQGRGITFINGKIAFIENALPGEIVDINIVKENKKIIEANVNNYIKTSEDRVMSPCPYYSECGGCDLMHMPYEKQLEYKTNKVKDIMKRYASIDPKIIKNIVQSPDVLNYRNKVTLKVNKVIGYYKKKSYEIVPIKKCLLASDKINKIIDLLSKYNDLENINEIVIRSINEIQTSLTVYLQNQRNVDDFVNYIQEHIDSIIFLHQNKVIKTIGNGNIIGRLDKFEYQMSPQAFFQVNTNQTINLYNKIREEVKKMDDPIILDLYCGTGSIGIYVSDYVKKVIGVEINASAVKNAEQNAKLNNLTNVEYFVGDTKTILQNNTFHADLIIVDPPRSGLDPSVVNDIIKISPLKLIYVSCDPITLARDLDIFKNEYDILEITPFDMFPNTHHVESVSLLQKK